MADNNEKISKSVPSEQTVTVQSVHANPHDNKSAKHLETSPNLEAKSKRSPESRRTIAFNHLKGGYKRSSNEDYLNSLTKMEIKVSLDLTAVEWGKFLEAHYELNELATTSDAERVNAEFFTQVAALYAATRSLLEERLEYLEKHPDEAFGKDIHFNEKGEISHTSHTPTHANNTEVSNVNSEHSTPSESSSSDKSAPRKTKEAATSKIPVIFEGSNDESVDVENGSKQHFNATFNLKLEPIRIPMFDGEKENWVLFRDQFLALVHNNMQMNDAIKMHQLFTHLGEKASRVIKGITPVGSNYGRAWKILNERFNNNQMLINHHLKRFFNLPALIRDEPTKLITLVDGVNELVNSLPGLEEPMKNWDAILIFCIFNKSDIKRAD